MKEKIITTVAKISMKAFNHFYKAQDKKVHILSCILTAVVVFGVIWIIGSLASIIVTLSPFIIWYKFGFKKAIFVSIFGLIVGGLFITVSLPLAMIVAIIAMIMVL